MDNASYHSIKLNEAPTTNSKKTNNSGLVE